MTHWVIKIICASGGRNSFFFRNRRIACSLKKKGVIDALAHDPECGEVIPGTGGVRKVRVALSGGGKGSGSPVVYYYLDETVPLLALAVYKKNFQVDFAQDERKAVASLAREIKNAARSKR